MIPTPNISKKARTREKPDIACVPLRNSLEKLPTSPKIPSPRSPAGALCASAGPGSPNSATGGFGGAPTSAAPAAAASAPAAPWAATAGTNGLLLSTWMRLAGLARPPTTSRTTCSSKSCTNDSAASPIMTTPQTAHPYKQLEDKPSTEKSNKVATVDRASSTPRQNASECTANASHGTVIIHTTASSRYQHAVPTVLHARRRAPMSSCTTDSRSGVLCWYRFSNRNLAWQSSQDSFPLMDSHCTARRTDNVNSGGCERVSRGHSTHRLQTLLVHVSGVCIHTRTGTRKDTHTGIQPHIQTQT